MPIGFIFAKHGGMERRESQVASNAVKYSVCTSRHLHSESQLVVYPGYKISPSGLMAHLLGASSHAPTG